MYDSMNEIRTIAIGYPRYMRFAIRYLKDLLCFSMHANNYEMLTKRAARHLSLTGPLITLVVLIHDQHMIIISSSSSSFCERAYGQFTFDTMAEVSTVALEVRFTILLENSGSGSYNTTL